MKYMGSKNKYAKELLTIILKKREDRWYVEPFVGGGNMIDKVTGNRIGADSNRYVIDALISIRDSVNMLPKNSVEFTEKDYQLLRKSDDYPHKGYAGFAFSFGGKWLGGWCRDKENRRDYVKESYQNAKKQSPFLQGVILKCCSYKELDIPKNSLIYCDPPYENTTGYQGSFDHGEFWIWCREKVNQGHFVFVSEYSAPNDFESIWEKEVYNSLTKDTGSKIGIEKLFIHKSQKDILGKTYTEKQMLLM